MAMPAFVTGVQATHPSTYGFLSPSSSASQNGGQTFGQPAYQHSGDLQANWRPSPHPRQAVAFPPISSASSSSRQPESGSCSHATALLPPSHGFFALLEHDDAEAGLLAAEAGDSPGLGSPKHKSLVASVKRLQRESDDGRHMWWRRCEVVGFGGRDPKRHSVQFIEGFFKALQNGTIPDVGIHTVSMHTDVRIKRLCIEEEDYLEQLVQHVKACQRRTMDWTKRWWKYCETYGGGMRDPRRHQTAFIEKFLSAQSSEEFITDSSALRADAVHPVHGASPPADAWPNGSLDSMTSWSL
eukprot:TRINITY_DN56868_c0_g1_i1.p1 TRINITY_DN56868_c0_g1~~TRINITY_DN56868_c0_g1_i1.p1  ORF type:complete len:308 (-),score=57.57 TRINITY_DN56868_c0_g1_i1:297-1190(-)